MNLGAAVSVSIADGQLSLRRDLFVIDDELRQSFIDARGERAQLVEEEIDPGFPRNARTIARCSPPATDRSELRPGAGADRVGSSE